MVNPPITAEAGKRCSRPYHLPTIPTMAAYRHHPINAPALLRALADVMEQHPHAYQQLTWSYPTEINDPWPPSRRAIRPPVVDASFSTRITIGQPELSLAMGTAYKRHGGDPSAFLTAPELEMLEAAS